MIWKPRRGWEAFLSRGTLLRNLGTLGRRAVIEVAANRFIFRRARLRGLAHALIMWGCVLAGAITFPLVWGWVHFETVPGDLDRYRAFVFGLPMQEFPVDSLFAFLIFHGLVWSSFLVIAGVMLAFRRRMIDHGAAAAQQFGQDILPLLLLFAISVTGLMLTASYTWMKGYAYDFLAILHAVVVILTLVWLPFGKLFHVFQRPAQLGVSFYKDAGARGEGAEKEVGLRRARRGVMLGLEAFKGPFDGIKERGGLERLFQKVDRAGFHRLDRDADTSVIYGLRDEPSAAMAVRVI